MEAQGTGSSGESADLNSLEKLETRIVEIVEQLRSARELQQEAEQEAEKLRGQLDEKEREIEQLKVLASGADGTRGEVRRRIEGLLEKIEGLG